MATIVFDGLAYGMLLFLVGVGLSITMGLMNFVNLAHGAFAMVGGYTAALLMSRLGWGFVPSLFASFVAGALVGGLLEWGLYRRLYRASPLDQVLFSIGLVFVFVSSFTYFFGAGVQSFTLPTYLEGRFTLGSMELGRYRLFLIASGVLVLAGVLLLLNKTRFGAMVRAAVDNQRVTAGMGIHVQRIFFLTFVLGSALAGLGGALSLGVLGMEPSFPLKYMIYFLIVVCVGGAGTIIGPFVAAVLVGIVDVAGKYYLPETGAFLIYGFMLVTLLLRPQGLIPRKGL